MHQKNYPDQKRSYPFNLTLSGMSYAPYKNVFTI